MKLVILLIIFAVFIYFAAKSDPDGVPAKIAKYVIAGGTAIVAAFLAYLAQFGGG